jgi:hypothetical protein
VEHSTRNNSPNRELPYLAAGRAILVYSELI